MSILKIRSRRLVWTIFCLAWVLGCSVAMSGEVTDRKATLVVETRAAEDGGLLPGVAVTVRHDRQGTEREVTGSSGSVTFSLRTGRSYEVACRFPGGRTESRTVEVLDADTVLRVPISMYKRVSLVDLIANGDSWEGEPVSVVGYLEIASEEAALYLHRDDWRWHISENAVWLKVEGGQTILQQLEDNRRNYVCVWGTFETGITGHMGNYSGGISAIEDITVLSSR